MQALLLSTQHQASPSGAMRLRAGRGGLPTSFKGSSSKRREELEFVGMSAAVGTGPRKAAHLSSSASAPFLRGDDGTVSLSSSGGSSLYGGGGSDIILPDGGVPSPQRQLKPLARRAPGAPAQTFLLSSPPGSAAAGGREVAGYGSLYYPAADQPEPSMSVPINPFLSVSSMSRDDYDQERSKLQSLTADGEEEEDRRPFTADRPFSSAEEIGRLPSQQGQEQEEQEEEGKEYQSLTSAQFKMKMTLEYGALMGGLEKALVTSNVGSINSLHSGLPAVKIADDASTASDTSLTITVPPLPARERGVDAGTTTAAGEEEEEQEQGKALAAQHDGTTSSSSLSPTGAEGQGEDGRRRKSVSFLEGSEEAAAPSSDGYSYGGVAAADPSYLGTEELFKALISAVKDDASYKGALPSQARHQQLAGVSMEEVLQESQDEGETAEQERRRHIEWTADPATPAEGEGEGEDDSSLSMNPWFADVKSSMRRWRKEVEKNLLTMSRSENGKYVEALGAAETEVHFLLQNRLRLERRVQEMEKSVQQMRRQLDLEAARLQAAAASSQSPQQQQRGQGTSNINVNAAEQAARELELVRRVGDLEQEVVRLRNAEPFANTTEFMRAQGEHAMRLREVKQALLFQAMVYSERAHKEEARITLGSGTVEALPVKERRAVQHLANSLKARAKLYADRARFANQELDKVLQSVIGDLEAFEKAVKHVLPQKSIMALLKWGLDRGTASTQGQGQA